MMNAGDIAFPHLGIYLENVPRSFSVFGFEIAFYGLIIGIGVLAGILMAVHQAKVTGENPDTIWDFAIYAVIFSVIGARIYYVIFAWDYYKDNLLSIFNTRNGGMAIYGGVIGAFLTLFLYCKIKKINPFRLGDLCVPGLILGQAIGRWGNFMNREVFGEYTDNFLARIIHLLEEQQVDASMLYTSDHGEDIFDDGRHLFLHASPVPSYYQLHVPFLLWTSDSYREEYPGIEKAASMNQQKNISSSISFFQTMMELAGIETPYRNDSLSVTSPLYTEKSRVYLNDHNEPRPLDDIGMRKEDFEMLKKRGIDAQ